MRRLFKVSYGLIESASRPGDVLLFLLCILSLIPSSSLSKEQPVRYNDYSCLGELCKSFFSDSDALLFLLNLHPIFLSLIHRFQLSRQKNYETRSFKVFSVSRGSLQVALLCSFVLYVLKLLPSISCPSNTLTQQEHDTRSFKLSCALVKSASPSPDVLLSHLYALKIRLSSTLPLLSLFLISPGVT